MAGLSTESEQVINNIQAKETAYEALTDKNSVEATTLGSDLIELQTKRMDLEARMATQQPKTEYVTPVANQFEESALLERYIRKVKHCDGADPDTTLAWMHEIEHASKQESLLHGRLPVKHFTLPLVQIIRKLDHKSKPISSENSLMQTIKPVTRNY